MEKTGLTSEEAKSRLAQFGPNLIPEGKPRSQLLIFLDQLKSPLVYVLIFAALVTVFLRDFKDAAVITFAILINTILGFIQESRAQKSLLALKKILTPEARVLRDGKVSLLPAQELVPGDLVILETGDKVPADGKLLETVELMVNEAILTGESMPVGKTLKTGENEVFMGTTVLAGRGKMEVLATGLGTKFGQIATALEKTEKEATPLQKRLDRLAKTLAILVGVVALAIFALGFLAGKGISEIFLTSVALAVAAIPEGLVVALTAILAIGMQRILKRKALVRKLLAAETLGSTTVICTDKTGTLTEGKFKVVSWEVRDENLALRLAALCNNLSEPLEIALWEYAQAQNHFDPQKIQEENPRLFEIPFSSERKFMATINRVLAADSQPIRELLFVKGAPEKILALAKISPEEKREWEAKISRWAQKGERVLGMGFKEVQKSKIKNQKEMDELAFLGLVGFSDPLRSDVRESLRLCRQAGIEVKLLTGDSRATAEAILAQAGIKVASSEIMEGEEIRHLSFEEIKEKVTQIKLFARIDPLGKLKVVEALQKRGEVVALIGDGVNDAPALKRADIGVVVGEATEVAKETADMVLLDSNFKTIVAAIEEGRGIFANLQKVVTYLLADAFSAIILIAGSLVLGLSLPLTASQILWINLISDGFPSLALTVDPKEKNLMKLAPRLPSEGILTGPIKVIIALVSTLTAIIALVLFRYYSQTQNLVLAQSLVFALLGLTTLFYVFSCRNLTRPIWKSNFTDNHYLVLAIFGGLALMLLPFLVPQIGQFLNLTPLSVKEWGMAASGAATVVFLIEVAKWVFNRLEKPPV